MMLAGLMSRCTISLGMRGVERVGDCEPMPAIYGRERRSPIAGRRRLAFR